MITYLTLELTVHTELQKIGKWLNANKPELNIKKSNYVNFSFSPENYDWFNSR